jgi:hypothetical protein
MPTSCGWAPPAGVRADQASSCGYWVRQDTHQRSISSILISSGTRYIRWTGMSSSSTLPQFSHSRVASVMGTAGSSDTLRGYDASGELR